VAPARRLLAGLCTTASGALTILGFAGGLEAWAAIVAGAAFLVGVQALALPTSPDDVAPRRRTRPQTPSQRKPRRR
jgi:hypothetical protein